MRKQFDLQKAQFSDDNDQDARLLPNDLIEMYNKEYSLVLSETKNFFADVTMTQSKCKDFFTRFITLNNMGIGFNLPLILNSMLKIEAEVINPAKNSKKPEINWKSKKEKYENNFIGIMKKMGQVIQDMLNFEVKIKSEYLGQAFSTPTTQPVTRINLATRPRNKTEISNEFKNIIQKKEDVEQEQAIRLILKKNLTPEPQNQQSVCSSNSSPTQNLEKLADKIKNLTNEIHSTKVKEQKIWKIFNQKRPSRYMIGQQTSTDGILQKQYKKLSGILKGIVVQKSKSQFASPYDTVESSIH